MGDADIFKLSKNKYLVGTENLIYNDYENFLTLYHNNLKGADFHIHTFEASESVLIATTHYHSHTEIIFVTEGALSIELTNQKMFLKENDLIILGPETLHSTYLETNGYSRHYILQFSNELLENISSSPAESHCIQKLLGMMRPFSHKLIPNSENSEEIKKLIINFDKEYYADNDISSSLSLKAEFLRFLSGLYRYTESEDGQTVELDSNSKEILKTVEFIQNHYQENITLEKMAKQANLSYHYYSRLFKEVTHINFSDYLAQVRITEAVKFIELGLSLKETAMKVGIQPQSAFSRTFKKLKGVSPNQYKETYINTFKSLK